LDWDQRPFGVRDDLAGVFKLTKEKVRVIVPDTGSGYGGKHSGEGRCRSCTSGKGHQQTGQNGLDKREEFTWAYFRPGGVIEVAAGVKKDGTIAGWKFVNYNSGTAGMETQYITANKSIAHLPSKTPLKQGRTARSPQQGMCLPVNAT